VWLRTVKKKQSLELSLFFPFHSQTLLGTLTREDTRKQVNAIWFFFFFLHSASKYGVVTMSRHNTQSWKQSRAFPFSLLPALQQGVHRLLFVNTPWPGVGAF
jgi:hypothetical protein